MMRQLLFFIVLLGVSPYVLATELGVHLGSKHSAPGYNNVNPGVYVKLENQVTLGIYHNSIRRTSIYAGYALEYRDFGVLLGAVSGYQGISGKGYLMPMVIPSYRGPYVLGVAPRVSVVPPTKQTRTVLHLSAEFVL